MSEFAAASLCLALPLEPSGGRLPLELVAEFIEDFERSSRIQTSSSFFQILSSFAGLCKESSLGTSFVDDFPDDLPGNLTICFRFFGQENRYPSGENVRLGCSPLPGAPGPN